MWEKTRSDGKRCLKRNAVPTIFNYTEPIGGRTTKKLSISTAALSENDNIQNPSIKRTLQETEEQPTTSTYVPASTMSTTSENPRKTRAGEDCDSYTSTTITASTSELVPSSSMSTNSPTKSLTKFSLDLTPKRRSDVCARQEERIKSYMIQTIRLKKKLRSRQRKLKKTQTLLKRVQEEKTDDNKYYKTLRQFLNIDEIHALQRSTKFQRWSNETIKKALKIKFSCGNNGYQQLLKLKYPLPSLRTLNRRLENLKFSPGILEEVFEFFQIKIDHMDEHEKDCVVAMDEMAITSSSVFDISTKQYLGNVDLPGHSGLATHALVFMLGGVNSRWKQTVAYYFTGMCI